MRVIWFFGLTAAACEDLRFRQVSFVTLLLLAVPGIGHLWYVWNQGLEAVGLHAAAATLAVMMLLLSKITEGAIGEGDGLFFLVSACYLDIWDLGILFLGSLGISCGWGMVLLLRRNMKQTIPFLTCAWPIGLWGLWRYFEVQG